jgi:protein gp37
MADHSNIEWTDATWNCIRGCSRISEGCRHCYAERVAARFSGPGQPYEGLAVMKTVYGQSECELDPLRAPSRKEPRWTGEVRFITEHLEDPLRWKKPRMIFVNSMSDLFHEDVPDEWIDRIFAVMALAPRHTFQVLTKRPGRMLNYLGAPGCMWRWTRHMPNMDGKSIGHWEDEFKQGALNNVWLGVSVEDQETADNRIPLLLQTPAAVRWVSYEPALGPVDFRSHFCGHCAGHDFAGGFCTHRKHEGVQHLDWIVCGGESGPSARPFDVQWAISTVKQCKVSKVPCFVKQLGAHPFDSTQPGRPHLALNDRKGGEMAEWPEGLRVREYPR